MDLTANNIGLLQSIPTSLPERSPNAEQWRSALYDELHTRPFPVLNAPCCISQLSVLRTPENQTYQRELEHLIGLCRRYSVSPPAENASCYFHDFGEFEFRWERHTEFSTYTVIRKHAGAIPFVHNAWALLPKDWVNTIEGRIVAATHITLENFSNDEHLNQKLNEHFEGQRKIAAKVLDQRAEIWTAFRLHSDGFGRYMIFCDELNACETGRLLQRVLEIESYRLLALMSLPLAREASPELTRIEAELAVLTKTLSQVQDYDERLVLNKLTGFAADIEHMRANIHFRISATRAYYALVMERLQELKQSPIEGLQTLSAFLDRRLTPGYRTCEATWDRLENIAQRIDRTADLVRTQIDLSIEEQNQRLLDSMNRRGKIQLRMQQTFEGLSMVAICYYLIGLIEQAIPALEAAGMDINKHLLIALAIPVSIISVFIFNKVVMYRIRKETLN